MAFLLKTFRALFLLLAFLSGTALLLGYFGSVHPSLDSFAHFRLHLAVLTVLAGLLLMLVRRKAVGFLFVFAAAIPLFVHMEYFDGRSPAEIVALVRENLPRDIAEKSDRLVSEVGTAPRYKLMHANLHFDLPDPKEFLRLVGEAKPDVLTLNEVSAVWLPVVETLKATYPQQLTCSASDQIGSVAILSKRPFAGDALNGCTNDGVLALQKVDFGGRVVMIGAAHLLWPWPDPQAQQITEMRDRLRAAGDAASPILFAGDLNAAPWSHAAKRISAFLNADVVTVPWGSWIHETVPSKYAWLGLPIDNVFAKDISVSSASRKPEFGSDHLPVLVEFSLEDVTEGERQTVLAN
jgi:endonuclease/exonuclease/phosphatase (EEP) superfamily protein YafD